MRHVCSECGFDTDCPSHVSDRVFDVTLRAVSDARDQAYRERDEALAVIVRVSALFERLARETSASWYRVDKMCEWLRDALGTEVLGVGDDARRR